MDDIIRQAIHDFRAYLQRRHYAAHTLANYTLALVQLNGNGFPF